MQEFFPFLPFSVLCSYQIFKGRPSVFLIAKKKPGAEPSIPFKQQHPSLSHLTLPSQTAQDFFDLLQKRFIKLIEQPIMDDDEIDPLSSLTLATSDDELEYNDNNKNKNNGTISINPADDQTSREQQERKAARLKILNQTEDDFQLEMKEFVPNIQSENVRIPPLFSIFLCRWL